MTALTWAIRLIIFFVLVVFALQNTDPVNLHILLGQVWQAPLVIVLLAFFAGGALLGALSLLGVIYRQRREIARLKRVLGQSPKPVVAELPPDA
jgi:uncharacterized integral membrane protein